MPRESMCCAFSQSAKQDLLKKELDVVEGINPGHSDVGPAHAKSPQSSLHQVHHEFRLILNCRAGVLSPSHHVIGI